jgi:hypothetical protein
MSVCACDDLQSGENLFQVGQAIIHFLGCLLYWLPLQVAFDAMVSG